MLLRFHICRHGSLPVPGEDPENRSVQEVQVGRAVPGVPRQRGSGSIQHQNWWHHLPVAIQTFTQVWTGGGNELHRYDHDEEHIQTYLHHSLFENKKERKEKAK